MAFRVDGRQAEATDGTARGDDPLDHGHQVPALSGCSATGQHRLRLLRFLIFAYEAEEADEESEPAEAEQSEAVLACRAAPAQCRDLVAMIEGIVAAGRPICRLCLGPIDPEGHVCARSNGHRSEDELEALS